MSMNINFTGRHLEVTDALRTYASEKLNHLRKLYNTITRADVVFSVEKLSQIAETTLHVNHSERIHAEAKSSDMYASVDALVKKLERQLEKSKNA
jgi:putative sigma-54 modulation protein